MQNGKRNGMKVLFLFLFFLVPVLSRAQQDSTSHLRISLLTIGVGDEIYASFGHTGIRVIDSAAGTDRVYNWGTFDGFQEGFEMKFMRGKLLYYAAVETFAQCRSTYVYEQRMIEEQELILNAGQKQKLQEILKENIREENKYYKYDFLFDNCATRPRDIFKQTFGSGFQYGPAIAGDYKPTFRDAIHRYLAHLPFERFGIDMLLGSRIDRKMSNEETMFLPDYLHNGVRGAQLNGVPVAAESEIILSAKGNDPAGFQPFWLTAFLSLITIISLLSPSLNRVGYALSSAIVLISGLLGCLMLFMWFGTDHQSCRDNWNLLWALPTNVIVPFVRKEKLERYSVIAIVLILCAFLTHLFGMQSFALLELVPVWLVLLLHFGLIFKQSSNKSKEVSLPGL